MSRGIHVASCIMRSFMALLDFHLKCLVSDAAKGLTPTFPNPVELDQPQAWMRYAGILSDSRSADMESCFQRAHATFQQHA